MPSHIICVSGPEGVGKDTLINLVLAIQPRLTLGKKATTRPPREDDYIDGISKYEYIEPDEFMRRVARVHIVEHSENANGCLYGSYVDLNTVGVELRELDLLGARQLLALSHTVSGFPSVTLVGILPTIILEDEGPPLAELFAMNSRWDESGIPDLVVDVTCEEVRRRLEGRGDPPDLVDLKVKRARWQIPVILRTWPAYIINDDRDQAARELAQICAQVLEDEDSVVRVV